MERAINESYYEIFVKYVWRRDEFRSYISRRASIMLQNGFVRAGVSPICQVGLVCSSDKMSTESMEEKEEFSDVTLVYNSAHEIEARCIVLGEQRRREMEERGNKK